MTWASIVPLKQVSKKGRKSGASLKIVLPRCVDSGLPGMAYTRAAQFLIKVCVLSDRLDLTEKLSRGEPVVVKIVDAKLPEFPQALEIRTRLDWWEALGRGALEFTPKKKMSKSQWFVLPEVKLGRRLSGLIQLVKKGLLADALPNLRTLLSITDIVEELSVLGIRSDAHKYSAQDKGRSEGREISAANSAAKRKERQGRIDDLVRNKGLNHQSASHFMARNEGGTPETIERRTAAIRRSTENPNPRPKRKTPHTQNKLGKR